MENRLKTLFDFQKFENNSRLDSIIGDALAAKRTRLDADDLSAVFAAGASFVNEDQAEKNTLF